MGWAKDTQDYLIGVRVEFRKITWPLQDETVNGTIGVVVVVTVVAVVLGAVDFVLSRVMQLVLNS